MLKLPSRHSANVLYLLTMLLILTVGSMMQLWALSPGLIGSEVLLILFPTLLFIRLNKLPIRETLRLRWPGFRVAMLGLLIGAALWPLSLVINGLCALLFGYTPPTPPGWIPSNVIEAVLLFAALAVAAPVCEEIMWRGYIQRAYEQFGPWVSVVIVSSFFAFWHLRFQGLLPLIPIALALGYLRWRSNSLVPGILAHSAVNGLQAAIVIAMGLGPEMAPTLTAILGVAVLCGAVIGIVIVVIGLVLVWQWATPITMEPPQSAEKPRRVAQAWPLIVVGVIYVVCAIIEVWAGRFPQSFDQAASRVFPWRSSAPTTTSNTVVLNPAPWQAPVSWHYEVRNIVGDRIGERACQLTPETSTVTMVCSERREAYQVKYGGGTYQGSAGEMQDTVRWDASTLNVLEATSKWNDEPELVQVRTVDGGLELTNNAGQTVTFPAYSLLPDEWAWRLAALPFETFHTGRTVFTWPSYWLPEIQASKPLTRDVTLRLKGQESVTTPAGEFTTWRVELRVTGSSEVKQSWYDVNAPHTLVKYDNGMATWLLR